MLMWRVAGLAVLLTAMSSPAAAAAPAPDLSALTARLEQIVRSSPGDVGVALAHLESGTRLSIHGDQRFPMASVYKLPIAIEALAQVAEGKLELARKVTLGPNDIRACCTLSRRYPRGGVTLPLSDLIELMMIESDNTAVDAVLKLVGGPAVVERRLRAQGFNNININRYDAQISLEMTGVREPVADSDWTLELQRRLIAAVTPADLHKIYIHLEGDALALNSNMSGVQIGELRDRITSERIPIVVGSRDENLRRVFTSAREQIARLVRASDVAVSDRLEAPKASARAVLTGGAELAVPLEGLIDFEQE